MFSTASTSCKWRLLTSDFFLTPSPIPRKKKEETVAEKSYRRGSEAKGYSVRYMLVGVQFVHLKDMCWRPSHFLAPLHYLFDASTVEIMTPTRPCSLVQLEYEHVTTKNTSTEAIRYGPGSRNTSERWTWYISRLLTPRSYADQVSLVNQKPYLKPRPTACTRRMHIPIWSTMSMTPTYKTGLTRLYTIRTVNTKGLHYSLRRISWDAEQASYIEAWTINLKWSLQSDHGSNNRHEGWRGGVGLEEWRWAQAIIYLTCNCPLFACRRGTSYKL